VPLSEHEQRLLEQMERALYAEDPKFASSLRSAGPRPGSRRKAAVGVLGGLVGVALLITGAATSIIAVGVAGFLVMLVGTFVVITTMRAAPAEEAAPGPAAPSRPAPAQNKSGFMDRVEERFRKRREGDGS
jgi:predicted lipid-binding transport protein (Tim44 family)